MLVKIEQHPTQVHFQKYLKIGIMLSIKHKNNIVNIKDENAKRAHHLKKKKHFTLNRNYKILSYLN